MGGLGVHSTADWVTAKISDCFAPFVSVCDDCIHISIECKCSILEAMYQKWVLQKDCPHVLGSFARFIFRQE